MPIKTQLCFIRHDKINGQVSKITSLLKGKGESAEEEDAQVSKSAVNK